MRITAPTETRWVERDLGLRELGLCDKQGLFLKEMGALASQATETLQGALRELSRARGEPCACQPSGGRAA